MALLSCGNEDLIPANAMGNTNNVLAGTYTGTFSSNSNGSSASLDGVTAVVSSVSSTKVKITFSITGLGDLITDLAATTNGNDLTIAKQTVDGVEYVGTGKLTGNSLSISGTSKENATTDTFNYTGTKK